MKENLVLEGYGITLRRLTSDKIEMVRQWRNDPKIQQYMVYRQEITPEMQKKWFDKVNNDNNFYFIIEYQGKEVGLVNIKDIDYENKCGETGTFIYDEDCLNSDVAIRASCTIHDFIFNVLKLDYVYAHILMDNKRALQYNQIISSHIVPEKSTDNIAFVKRYKEEYYNNSKLTKIRKLLEKSV